MSQVQTESVDTEECWTEEDSGSGTGITSNSSNASTTSEKSNYQDDPTNLIVNYLPVYFTEDHLRELFSSYGQIESLIVMYNKHDYRKKSKGYGFVKFSTPEESAAAIKGVDGTRIANKTVKVSVARPGRARRASNVFVSRLPPNWKDSNLKKAFQKFGHIVECRVLTFGDGVSRRCGFVRYDSDDEAKLAMRQMRNFRPTPRDAPLQVNLSVNHSPDARTIAQAEKEMAMNGMYGGYRPTARDDYYNSRADFMHMRREYNPIDDFMYGQGRFNDYNSMNSMIDPLHSMGGFGEQNYYNQDYNNYSSRSPVPGLGYRDYRSIPARSNSHSRENYRCSPDTFGSTLRSASSTGDGMHSSSSSHHGDQTYASHTSEQSYISEQAPDQPAAVGEKQRLFIQNLPPFYEETHLKQLFSSYGEITGVTIQRDRNGKSIQCAFVVFAVAADAQRASHALDGVMLSTQTLKILLL